MFTRRQSDRSATSSDIAETVGACDEIAGYRIIRTLGTGGRATVFLGHGEEGPDGRTAAVKVFREDVETGDIDRELQALARGSSEHVVRVLDASASGGRCHALVLEHLASGSLAQLLSVRARLAPGEAVTILASLIHAVADMHAAGFAHGRLRPSSVLFDPRGCPKVIGLGHVLTVDGTVRPEDADADYRALARIVHSVVDRVDTVGRAETIARFIDACDRAAEHRGTRDHLEPLVFAIAPPAPVDTSEDAFSPYADRPSDLPSRIFTDIDGPTPDGDLPRRRGRRARRTHSRGEPAAAAAGLLGMLRTRVRGRGRRIGFAGVLAASIVAAALGLLPPAQATTGSDASPDPDPTRSTPPSRAGPPLDGATDDAGDSARTRDAVRSDDPVAAGTALLHRRASCLRGGGRDCLLTVDEPGSGAERADRTASEEPGAPRQDFLEDTVRLVQRLGDSALLSLTPPADAEGAGPATMLLVKGASGWRIREFFTENVRGPAGTGSSPPPGGT